MPQLGRGLAQSLCHWEERKVKGRLRENLSLTGPVGLVIGKEKLVYGAGSLLRSREQRRVKVPQSQSHFRIPSQREK